LSDDEAKIIELIEKITIEKIHLEDGITIDEYLKLYKQLEKFLTNQLKMKHQ